MLKGYVKSPLSSRNTDLARVHDDIQVVGWVVLCAFAGMKLVEFARLFGHEAGI